ncbi:rhodanese-like domain-containing protein [Rheinheimera sp. 1928-s]|uniref:rhodanese-like domain-containing protein n=1 Tax=Rheinheimera sp. 1928-s TaxID=3033803 RepID=UPI00261F193C|nr:rhodanese-like domain-containing protein [Rheinheimera sp. 1928-s]MDF3127183.1 rhodanese-like domain-containing protein [Rheinheimera sp. 1928-s]
MKNVLILLLLWAPMVLAQSLWIDVRTAEEYKAGHLEGAINIPYNEIEQKITDISADKTADIQLYCRSGRRSGIALETLTSMGYSNVTNAGAYEQLKQKQPKSND